MRIIYGGGEWLQQPASNKQEIYELKLNKAEYSLANFSMVFFPFFHPVFKILLRSSRLINLSFKTTELPLF